MPRYIFTFTQFIGLLAVPFLQCFDTVGSMVGRDPAYRNYYYNRFTTLWPGIPRWVGTRRINHSGFCWSRHVTVASAEPWASYLHFAPEDNHASTSSVRFLRCPSWHPTNSVNALKSYRKLSGKVLAWLSVCSKVQMTCIWSSWFHCHPIISCVSKIHNGLPFWLTAYPGCPGYA